METIIYLCNYTVAYNVRMNFPYIIVGLFNPLNGRRSKHMTEILGEIIKINDKSLKIRCNDGNEYLINRNIFVKCAYFCANYKMFCRTIALMKSLLS